MSSSSNQILVIDDDRTVRESLVEFLSAHGYPAKSAASGGEALQKLHRDPDVSLILLDLAMPVMDGRQFRHLQLDDPTISEIPVVIVSAEEYSDRTVEDLKPIAALKKPVHPDCLLGVVEALAGPP